MRRQPATPKLMPPCLLPLPPPNIEAEIFQCALGHYFLYKSWPKKWFFRLNKNLQNFHGSSRNTRGMKLPPINRKQFRLLTCKISSSQLVWLMSYQTFSVQIKVLKSFLATPYFPGFDCPLQRLLILENSTHGIVWKNLWREMIFPGRMSWILHIQGL